MAAFAATSFSITAPPVALRRTALLPCAPRRPSSARPHATPLRAALPSNPRAEAATDVRTAPPARAPHPPRKWKPLQVFSVSPFQAERANRVRARRRASGTPAPPAPGADGLGAGREQLQDPIASIELIVDPPATSEAAGRPASGAMPAATPAAPVVPAPAAPAAPAAEHRPSRGGGGGAGAAQRTWPQYASHAALVEDALSLRGDPLEGDGGRVVLFRGDPGARVMVIGEAPGADEDRLGLPFVGRSGQLLDRIFRFAGFAPERDLYVTNAVKRRPRGNRAPTAAEAAFYRGLLLEEIRLVDPALIVVAGRAAMHALLPDAGPISRMRGRWYSVGARVVMPVFHPSYLLRNPDAKKMMKEDVLAIRERFLETFPDAQIAEVRNQGSA